MQESKKHQQISLTGVVKSQGKPLEKYRIVRPEGDGKSYANSSACNLPAIGK